MGEQRPMIREQRQKLPEAEVAAALQHEKSNVPSREQIVDVTLLARALYTACWA